MANGFKTDNAPGCGLQPWSRGSIFPLVIARVEHYSDDPRSYVENYLMYTTFDVIGADDDMSGFASYDDAFLAAAGWLVDKIAKRQAELPLDPEATYAYEVWMAESDCGRGRWEAIDSFQAAAYRLEGFTVRRFEV